MTVRGPRHVYLGEPRERIAATLAMLRWYRAFLASGCERARSGPRSDGFDVDRRTAEREFRECIHVAINRKGRLAVETRVPRFIATYHPRPDGTVTTVTYTNGTDGRRIGWRKLDGEYQTRLRRDAYRVRDIVRDRVRVYQFETPEIRRRYGHLLSRYDD